MLDQINEYDRIGSYIEDFIEHTRQFRMKDETRIVILKNIQRVTISHAKVESVTLKGDIIET